ncbi:MAG: DUF547 domain-containing protein [Acidobacteriota bacterium]|nr:MAG: DUF547 domain-containing protein [Acidobacteriota bacterium]
MSLALKRAFFAFAAIWLAAGAAVQAADPDEGVPAGREAAESDRLQDEQPMADERLVNPVCPEAKRDSLTTPDMTLWDKVVKAHVRRGIVNYRAIAEEANFKKFLASWDCINLLAARELGKKERAAMWLNIYNAHVVAHILKHYPVSSVERIPDFYKQRVARIGGRHTSALHLADEVRYLLEDARVGFALCRGSLGGPTLREEAYTAERLDAQLENQTRRFFADRNKFHLDKRGKFMRLSKVFRWEQRHIVRIEGAILKFFARYVPPEDAELVQSGTLSIRFSPYDADLNGETLY